MAFRQRTPTFRPQLSVRRVYETMQPRSEIKETPEAYLLHVYIPGFSRDSVKITYAGSSRMVRITGERLIQGNRWSRIDQSYPVPDYCEPDALQGKFETGILILTMPKKVMSQVAPKQPAVETTQEKGVADQAKPDGTGQKAIPPQTTTTKLEEPIEEKKSVSPPKPVEDPADLKTLKDKIEGTPYSVPSEPIKDQSPPKGQEEAIERPAPKETSKPQMGEQEFKPKPTQTMETKMLTDEKPQKGQEELEPKTTPTIPTKIKTDEKPPKGQEEIEPNSTIKTVTKKPTEDKLQEDIGVKTMLATGKEKLKEKKTEGTRDEDEEKKRISKKEVKDEDHEKPSESRKPVKDKEKVSSKKKETKAKKLSTKEAEPSTPKAHKKKEKGGKGEENVMSTEGNTGIGEVVGSVFQVVTKIAEGKWNEEEKQLVTNIGAAILVIATLGAYVSYRFAS